MPADAERADARLRGRQDAVVVVGVDDRPDQVVGLIEGQSAADDLHELRRAPERPPDHVVFEHAGPGRAQSQFEPVGIDLGFLAGLDQRQFLTLAGVDIQDEPDHLVQFAIGPLVHDRADIDPTALAGRQGDPELVRADGACRV